MAQFDKELTAPKVNLGNRVFQEFWRLVCVSDTTVGVVHVPKFLTVLGPPDSMKGKPIKWCWGAQ